MSVFIGVDVGGTKVAVARLENGELTSAGHTLTEKGSAAALLDQMANLINSVRTDDVQAVGIGVPSTVEFATGRVRGSVNIPLVDLPLRTILSERIGIPVFVDNDASCAAFAEAHDEGKLVCRDLVMLTVGTGVGGGLVLNGQLYRGSTGAAAELGHQLIGMDLRLGAPPASEKFPQMGSLEECASGRALDRLAMEAAENDPHSYLGERLKEYGQVAGKDVVDAAVGGDSQAESVLRILGERLGIGVANAINIFDPQEVVIGGGVSIAGPQLLEPIVRVARQYTIPGSGTSTHIRLARHGVRAGVLGAALIAKQEATALRQETATSKG